eukprot:scaffold132683_cov36-Phaeocystis_antarctica.AAC.1
MRCCTHEHLPRPPGQGRALQGAHGMRMAHMLHMRIRMHMHMHMHMHIAGLHRRGAQRVALRPAHRGRVRPRAPNTCGCSLHTAAAPTAHSRSLDY